MEGQPSVQPAMAPSVACVCDRIVSHATTRRISSCSTAGAGRGARFGADPDRELAKAQVIVGLSWRKPRGGSRRGGGRRPAGGPCFFPAKESPAGEGGGGRRARSPARSRASSSSTGRGRRPRRSGGEIPGSRSLPAIADSSPKEPSIYGSLRAEPKREYVSTLESVRRGAHVVRRAAGDRSGPQARLSYDGAASPGRAHSSRRALDDPRSASLAHRDPARRREPRRSPLRRSDAFASASTTRTRCTYVEHVLRVA